MIDEVGNLFKFIKGDGFEGLEYVGVYIVFVEEGDGMVGWEGAFFVGFEKEEVVGCAMEDVA